MGPGSAAHGVAIALAVLFASAVVHKLLLVRAGTVDADPLIARRAWTARRARAVAMSVAGAEALLVAALLLVPRIGLPAASITLLFYARELRQVAWETPCHCFAVTTRATAGTAVLRDLVLVVAAGAATAIVWAEADGATVRWLAALLVAAATLLAIYLGEAAALRHHESRSGGATAA